MQVPNGACACWTRRISCGRASSLRCCQTRYFSSFTCAWPGMRVVDADYKLRQSIKVAMLYLEDDDAVSAEMFIKKAATLIATCKARLDFRV